MVPDGYRYAGFWLRVAASLIDTVLVLCITLPLLLAVYGVSPAGMTPSGFAAIPHILISYVVPAIAVIAFWVARQATPGKMVFGARIVDANTGNSLTVLQSIGRYLGYFVSTIPFGLGLIWVAFDPRKQGWHDKLAGTVVVRPTSRAPVAVTVANR
jgi:uncharacterized RDD family membrane protein YckC